MILSPDFTKQEECCKVENDARIIYKENQVIKFESPVYGDTIDITLIGTIPKPFVRDTDWTITEEDIDQDATARLKLANPSFNAEIVKSIRTLRTIDDGTHLRIALTYQQVYPLRSQEVLLHGKPISFTPDLFREMLGDIDYLKALTNPVTSVHGVPDPASPRLLEEDPYKENPDNAVVDEMHDVNVPNGLAHIHPVAGPFYRDSVSLVYHPEDGAPKKNLIEDEDYVIIAPDRAKTATTPNKSGVFTMIYLLQPYVGKIAVSYHAYGGAVTRYDHVAMTETINNVINHLNGISAVTPATLTSVPSFQYLAHQVYHMREEMRRLLKTGQANYGDLTSGMTLLKKLVSKDEKTHWWNIASLYKVDTTSGESEVQTAGQFHFILASLNKKLMFEAIVSVNLNNKDEGNVMEVTVLNDNCPKGYKPFEYYANLDLIPRPQLRVIYNDNDQTDSGVYLQLGMKLTGILEETIAVADVSGKESCWKLIPSIQSDEDTGDYQDNIVTLPNDKHVWDELNPDSKYESTLIPFKKGHLVWAGAKPVNRPTSGKITLELEHFLDDNIDIKSISKARVELEEYGGNRFAQEMVFIDGTDEKIGNASFFYNGAAAYINVHICRVEGTGELKIIVECDTAAGLSANQLDLKHLFLFA